MTDLPELLTSRVSRSENETHLTRADRGDQLFVVIEIVLKIGILDQDDVASRDAETCTHRVALARGLVLKENSHSRMTFVGEHVVAGAVLRVRFHKADFDVDALDPLGQQLFDNS